MEKDLSSPEFEGQKREAIYFSLEAIGRKLFPLPDNPRIIWGITGLNPLPLAPSFSPLIIIRVNRDGSAQGCFLDLEAPSAEPVKEGGDSIKSLPEKLCKSHDCSLEVVQGVVVFMGGVDLMNMEEDLKEIIEELSLETQFWFIEPHIVNKKLSQEEKKTMVRFLKETLNLVDSKSVEVVGGLCYSTGNIGKRKKAEQPAPAQLEF